jgi:hypothetical protein
MFISMNLSADSIIAAALHSDESDEAPEQVDVEEEDPDEPWDNSVPPLEVPDIEDVEVMELEPDQEPQEEFEVVLAEQFNITSADDHADFLEVDQAAPVYAVPASYLDDDAAIAESHSLKKKSKREVLAAFRGMVRDISQSIDTVSWGDVSSFFLFFNISCPKCFQIIQIHISEYLGKLLKIQSN